MRRNFALVTACGMCVALCGAALWFAQNRLATLLVLATSGLFLLWQKLLAQRLIEAAAHSQIEPDGHRPRLSVWDAVAIALRIAAMIAAIWLALEMLASPMDLVLGVAGAYLSWIIVLVATSNRHA